ncbi:MAG: hypothetical protein ACTS7D_00580 [Candidatus Hodgkinia cicadicola]
MFKVVRETKRLANPPCWECRRSRQHDTSSQAVQSINFPKRETTVC